MCQETNATTHHIGSEDGLVPSVVYPKETIVNNMDNTRLKLSQSKFYYSRLSHSCQWYTCVGKKRSIGIAHPFMGLSKSQHRALATFLNVEMIRLGITRLDCHYQVCVLADHTNNVSRRAPTKFTFRCNPSYRSNYWFDWMNVEYLQGICSDSVPSRLCMLLSHKQALGNHYEKNVLYALVNSLSSQKNSPYSDLKCWSSDKLYINSKVVLFEKSVSGPVYVLPGINRMCMDVDLKEDILSNDYYIVVPSRETWSDIGWDDLT